MSQSLILQGLVAGTVAAAILQPLQNIKVTIIVPPDNLKTGTNLITNFTNASKFLAKQNGMSAFYKGIVPNVLKTGFASGIYFESLRAFQRLDYVNKSTINSFVMSAAGRIISSIVSNPLCVLETRFQLPGKQRWAGGISKNLARIVRQDGFTGLFKGCLAMCYKEGLFGGLYYALYLQGKAMGVPSFPAGIVAGVIATTATHPFQLIRTKLQVQAVVSNQKIVIPIHNQLTTLAKKGQLLRGLGPRLIKKPVSNTIAFGLFELMEKQANKIRN